MTFHSEGLFSLIASCRLHRLDPEQYLSEVMRVLREQDFGVALQFGNYRS